MNRGTVSTPLVRKCTIVVLHWRTTCATTHPAPCSPPGCRDLPPVPQGESPPCAPEASNQPQPPPSNKPTSTSITKSKMDSFYHPTGTNAPTKWSSTTNQSWWSLKPFLRLWPGGRPVVVVALPKRQIKQAAGSRPVVVWYKEIGAAYKGAPAQVSQVARAFIDGASGLRPWRRPFSSWHLLPRSSQGL